MRKTCILATVGSVAHGFALPGVSNRDYAGVYIEAPGEELGGCWSDNGQPHGPRHEGWHLWSASSFLYDAQGEGGDAALAEAFGLAFTVPPLLQHADAAGARLAAIVRGTLSLGAVHAFARAATECIARAPVAPHLGRPPHHADAFRFYGHDPLAVAHALRLAQQALDLATTGSCGPRLRNPYLDAATAGRRGRLTMPQANQLLDTTLDAITAAVAANAVNLPAAAPLVDAEAVVTELRALATALRPTAPIPKAPRLLVLPLLLLGMGCLLAAVAMALVRAWWLQRRRH